MAHQFANSMLRALVPLLVVALSSGCTITRIDTDALSEAPPLSIGVVIGHDYRAKEAQTSGGEVAEAASVILFGAIGALAVAAADSAKDERGIEIVDELNRIAFDEIRGPLEEAGYCAELVRAVHNEGGIRHVDDGKELHAELVTKYDAAGAVNRYDALLFAEVNVEIGVPDLGADFAIDSSVVEEAYSRLTLHRATGHQLFFDFILKGYSVSSKTSIRNALDDILSVELIPGRPALETGSCTDQQ